MNDYRKLPRFRLTELHRIYEGSFGEAVAGVTALIGPCTDEHAQRVVEAVLGPLKLVSPKPDHYGPCDHSYFTYEGGWHFCTKEHDPNDKDEDPEFHRSSAHEWYSDGCEDRAFGPEERQ